jgi:hypothetical protein
MTWNTDMTAAPRGETKQVRLPEKQGGGYRDVTVKVPILISSGGEVYQTYWSEKRGQWMGLSDKETADAWQPWPQPYEAKT